MNQEQFEKSRNALKRIHSDLGELERMQDELLSEDTLTIKFIRMMIAICLAAWNERYRPVPF